MLFIPLVRGLFLAITGGFTSWVRGAWFDILVVMLILAIGVITYKMTTFNYNSNFVSIKRGVIFKRTKILPTENIITALLTSPFYLRPFKACILRLDTIGGSGKKSDFNLILHTDMARKIVKEIKGDDYPTEIAYKSNPIYILAFSLISSNSFAGIVLITTAITQLGKIVGTEISQRIVGTFQTISKALAFGIPPAAAAFAYLLFFGWLVAFTSNVIRHKNLQVLRTGNVLSIKSGIFTTREYTIKPTAISYMDIKQTIITKIFGVYSVSIYAIGYGKEKNGIHVIIPAASKKTLPILTKRLLPKLSVGKRDIKPNFGSIIRFLTDPLYPCVLIPLITLLLTFIYPEWNSLLLFMALIGLIPSVWFLGIRFLDFLSSGISYKNNCFTLKYSKGFYLHTISVPKDKIACVRIRQSIIQKFSNKCDVFIYTNAEGKIKHRLRNLPRTDVECLFTNKLS